MAAGRFEEAIPIYTELSRALPNNPGLLMNLGMALHMAGQDRKAAPQFEAVLKLQPDHVPARLFLGAALIRLGEPAKAVGPLRRVLQAEPANQQARQMLGDAFLALERFEPAAEQFRRLAELDPKNPQAWYGLVRSYESLSQRAFAALGKLSLESGYWLALVAAARLTQQQHAGAFYFYRQALERLPSLRGARAALAEIYRKTGHPDWAAVEDEKERRLGPPDCTVQKMECDFFAGRFRQMVNSAGNQKTAEAFYWRARACNELAAGAFSRLAQLPPGPDWHELMAELHRNQGRHREAVKHWQEALKISPGARHLERELAISLHQSRDHQSAQTLLRVLLKGEPDSAELNYLIGDTTLSLQQPDNAIPFLQKAVEKDPSHLPAQASLGRAYLQAGRGQQAVPHLEAALASDEDGSLHFQLARAYQISGQQEPARQTLEKYQQMQRSARAERQKLEQEIQITPP